MPGRAPWSTPGSKGSGETVATQNRPELESVNATRSGSVSSGTTEVTEVYAPTGSTYSIVDMLIRVSADQDATSGTHSVNFRNGDDWATIFASSTYNQKLVYLYHEWGTANDFLAPSTTEEMIDAIDSLRATDSTPLTIKYQNSLDVAQENSRQYKFVMEKVSY